MKNKTIILISLILVGITTRLIPHLPNFTAIGAVALFSGAMFKKRKIAFIVPLVAMFVSDLLLNNIVYSSYYLGFQWLTLGWEGVYAAFFITVILGKSVNSYRIYSIAAGATASAVIFFLSTNFSSWIASPIYNKDISGLLTAYIAGVPFFVNQLLGNLFYSAALFSITWVWLGSQGIRSAKV